jgi:hypothetical protein
MARNADAASSWPTPVSAARLDHVVTIRFRLASREREGDHCT